MLFTWTWIVSNRRLFWFLLSFVKGIWLEIFPFKRGAWRIQFYMDRINQNLILISHIDAYFWHCSQIISFRTHNFMDLSKCFRKSDQLFNSWSTFRTSSDHKFYLIQYLRRKTFIFSLVPTFFCAVYWNQDFEQFKNGSLYAQRWNLELNCNFS